MCQIFFMIMTPNFHKGSHQYQFTYLSILVIPSRLAAKCKNLVITHLLFTCQNSWAFFVPPSSLPLIIAWIFFSKTQDFIWLMITKIPTNLSRNTDSCPRIRQRISLNFVFTNFLTATNKQTRNSKFVVRSGEQYKYLQFL